MEPDAFLAVAQNLYQRGLIGSILDQAGIEYRVKDSLAPDPVLLALTAEPILGDEVWVPAGRLPEAKDVLCANGIVCEVSERLLRRSLDEIVVPLLGAKDRDLDRLIRFVQINNKETVRALFEATLKEEGGQAIIEDLFFQLAAEPEDARDLRILARVLKDRITPAFWERFLSEATGDLTDVRLALLEVLNELPLSTQRVEALVRGLRDPDDDIRDAASEALFALHHTDFGYDPEAPENEREEAIEKFLGKLFPELR